METFTTPVERWNDLDNVFGPGWHAWRVTGWYILDYMTRDHVGREEELDLSEDEYERHPRSAAGATWVATRGEARIACALRLLVRLSDRARKSPAASMPRQR